MIHIMNKRINSIPVLEVVQADKANKALPTVIYYHGFTGEKESSLTIAYKIAQNGQRVILPDSYLHGERHDSSVKADLELSFWNIVMKNINELKEIKTYLLEHKLADSDRIGIGGTSMGGITTYGALRTYPWIKAAVVLMGTAKMTDYAKMLIDHYNKQNETPIKQETADEVLDMLQGYDISLDPEMLHSRPLFIWHGEEDKVVPFKLSKMFYEEIEYLYKKNDHIKFLPEKNRSHHISKTSIAETAKWFQTFL